MAPIPVLAAGGIGSGRQMAAAMALGAQGCGSGTLWLTVEEADIPPEADGDLPGRLQPRHRAFALVHRQALPDAQERLDRRLGRREHPDPLPMPLQMMVAIEAVSRGHRYPEQAKDVNFNPCGQVIGRATTVRKAKDVVFSMVEDSASSRPPSSSRPGCRSDCPVGGKRRPPRSSGRPIHFWLCRRARQGRLAESSVSKLR